MLRTRLVLIFVGLLFCQAHYAQSDPPNKPMAYKFVEFGKISKGDLCEKLLSLYAALKKDRQLQGYVINYGTTAAVRARRQSWLQCIPFRGDDPVRITYVDGPQEPKIRTVMWVVPPGAENPIP
jgi:hypothetical protein